MTYSKDNDEYFGDSNKQLAIKRGRILSNIKKILNSYDLSYHGGIDKTIEKIIEENISLINIKLKREDCCYYYGECGCGRVRLFSYLYKNTGLEYIINKINSMLNHEYFIPIFITTSIVIGSAIIFLFIIMIGGLIGYISGCVEVGQPVVINEFLKCFFS